MATKKKLSKKEKEAIADTCITAVKEAFTEAGMKWKGCLLRNHVFETAEEIDNFDLIELFIRAIERTGFSVDDGNGCMSRSFDYEDWTQSGCVHTPDDLTGLVCFGFWNNSDPSTNSVIVNISPGKG